MPLKSSHESLKDGKVLRKIEPSRYSLTITETAIASSNLNGNNPTTNEFKTQEP